jgi:hypothetical protein
MALSAALHWLSANVPISIEGPATRELALIGVGAIAAYAVATRRIWRRIDGPRSGQAHVPRPQLRQVPRTANENAPDEPSRGAA